MLIITVVEVDLVRTDDAIQYLRIARNKRLYCGLLASGCGGGSLLVSTDEDPALGAVKT